MKKLSEKRICIVDHNQFSQTPKCINQEQIVGIIDHHATQSKTIQTSSPIYFDIRPWGSMSTILAHTLSVFSLSTKYFYSLNENE